MAELARLGFKKSDVNAVGITNQRETTILWDRFTGKPLYNAICECLLFLLYVA